VTEHFYQVCCAKGHKNRTKKNTSKIHYPEFADEFQKIALKNIRVKTITNVGTFGDLSMEEVETGSERVKKICDALRRDTLEPAKRQAEEIVLQAKKEAEGLLEEAKRDIEALRKEAREEIERQKNVFHSSLYQSCKQALETLKQSIEEKFLNHELMHLLQQPLQIPEVLAQLVQAVIQAVEKEGTQADLSVYIPAAIPARAVNERLGKALLDRLKEKSVLLSPIGGGIALKLHEQHITIDISDVALKELVAGYIRKDFRELFFGNG